MTLPAKVETTYTPLSMAISPEGKLYLSQNELAGEYVSYADMERIKALFVEGDEIGLLRFGLTELSEKLPLSLDYFYQISKSFFTEVCKLSGLDHLSEKQLKDIVPPPQELEELALQAPFIVGGEYLNDSYLAQLWKKMIKALLVELNHFDHKLENYLTAHNPSWNKVGRVCFHLAENKNNPQLPFAFLATYINRMSGMDTLKHMTLGKAMREYGADGKNANLLSMLLPVQGVAEKSPFIKNLVETGAIYHPQGWDAGQAYHFLKAIPLIEAAGVMVKVPNWWNAKKPPRPQVKISVGNEEGPTVGMNALLDFEMGFALPDGESLSRAEFKELLQTQGNLVQIRGQWIELDADRLNQVLSYWKDVEGKVQKEGLSFAQGLRLINGLHKSSQQNPLEENVADWTAISEGPWLKEALTALRHPEKDELNQQIQSKLKSYLKADLRPYQQLGVQWLWHLYCLRLGGCLADDMGLGKTIQVLSLFLLAKHMNESDSPQLNLLVLPASLLGNWVAEAKKFAPDLKLLVVHSSSDGVDPVQLKTQPALSGVDVVITSYGYVQRLPWLTDVQWNIIVLDEAQSIKNPGTKQTQHVKKLKAHVRFVLTGTPIENRLQDIWSLFDFTLPGLLGSSSSFSDYGKKIAKKNEATDGKQKFYAAIRHLISPYILRRLKTDKKIIADLPDKTEIKAYCPLTKQQAALYQHAVDELKRSLEQDIDDMKRRGLVLSYLMRFKQICNHPSQSLGHGQYDGNESGKFMRLKDICETIASKQEKVLVFTQYQEIIPALSEFLMGIFGKPGLVLHGGTPIKSRQKLVETFQQDHEFPYFVLSLKAGGTGLNLTRASHVIHFDRWWNPAVENQATDRAFRIGQKKNVLVHKFICQGTIEEKIDYMLETKKNLSDQILIQGGEANLTEMSNDELMKLVQLDIHRALGEM
ncbi:MAG: ATP-dependent helicase [Alphaproteobacteria bacterium]|nr:ATP-dependent helicase [Alphaproteobacteria bacterium]